MCVCLLYFSSLALSLVQHIFNSCAAEQAKLWSKVREKEEEKKTQIVSKTQFHVNNECFQITFVI